MRKKIKIQKIRKIRNFQGFPSISIHFHALSSYRCTLNLSKPFFLCKKICDIFSLYLKSFLWLYIAYAWTSRHFQCSEIVIFCISKYFLEFFMVFVRGSAKTSVHFRSRSRTWPKMHRSFGWPPNKNHEKLQEIFRNTKNHDFGVQEMSWSSCICNIKSQKWF